MKIDVLASNDVTIIAPEGRVDSNTAGSLEEALDEILERGEIQLVVDLQGIDYMSSAGLRALAGAMRQTSEVGGDVRLAAPQERVRAVLELSGMDSLFAIFATRAEAVASY